MESSSAQLISSKSSLKRSISGRISLKKLLGRLRSKRTGSREGSSVDLTAEAPDAPSTAEDFFSKNDTASKSTDDLQKKEGTTNQTGEPLIVGKALPEESKMTSPEISESAQKIEEPSGHDEKALNNSNSTPTAPQEVSEEAPQQVALETSPKALDEAPANLDPTSQIGNLQIDTRLDTQFTRTPLSPIYSAGAESPSSEHHVTSIEAVLNEAQLEPTETDGLLPKPVTVPRSLPRTKARWLIVLVVLLLLSAVFGGLYLIRKSLNIVVNSTTFETESFKVREVKDSSISFDIAGNVVYNLNSSSGSFLERSLSSGIKYVSPSFDVIEIQNVFVSMALAGSALYSVASFSLDQSVHVNLKNDQNAISLTSQEVEINTDGLILFLRDTVNISNLPFPVTMEIEARNARISSKFLSKTVDIKVRKDLKIDLPPEYFLNEEVFLEKGISLIETPLISVSFIDFFMESLGDEILATVGLRIEIKEDVLGNFTLNPIKWSVKTLGCDQATLFELASLEMGEIGPRLSYMRAEAFIPQIPFELLTECSTNEYGISVVNELLVGLMKKYDEKDRTMIFLQAHKSENPDWLSRVMSEILIPVNLNFVKQRFAALQRISSSHTSFLNISIPKLEVVLPKQMSKDDINPVISAEALIDVPLPNFLDDSGNSLTCNVTLFEGDMEISSENILFLDADFLLPQKLYLDFDYKVNHRITAGILLKDCEIDILEPQVLGELVKGLLFSQDGSALSLELNPSVTFSVENVPILNNGKPYVFRDVPFSLEYYLNLSSLLGDGKDDVSMASEKSPLLDKLLGLTEAEIVDVTYLYSDLNALSLMVKLKVKTPSFMKAYEYILKLTENGMDFNFGYNDTYLGHVLFNKFDIDTSQKDSRILMILELSPEEDSEEYVSELLSRFISNELPKIDVAGHSESFPALKKISQVLEAIKVGITLPDYNCPIRENLVHPTDDLSKTVSNQFFIPWFSNLPVSGAGKTLSNGFILGVTMHIMSLELEVEVYNPVRNSYIDVKILSAKAIYHQNSQDDQDEEIELAHLKKNTLIRVPPGVYKTPRLPITYETTGLAGEILRGAMNNKLDFETVAVFELIVGNFKATLEYRGDGTMAQIRL